jgi:predicted aspartyl protease
MTEFNALWDTGASVSVISGRAAASLGLQAMGRWTVYHANGSSKVNIYYVNVLLPNDISFRALRVSEGDLTGTDMLIGMDIISKGDFAITASLGKTLFSFQIPSTHEIDFTKSPITSRSLKCQ